ncbi:MAG: methylmalonyl-CoA mutase [Flavobacteriaceae bacterium]|nr:methylmalonyl-CoA mutase [Flavobacteriaceae bacterium]
MTEKLFNDFDAVSAAEWKQKIQFDLKGADYNETLIWNSNEGISVKPFYHADNKNDFNTSTIINKPFNICETIEVTSAEKANHKALLAREKGSESTFFIVDQACDTEKLLLNLGGDIHFSIRFLDVNFLKNLIQELSKKENQCFLNIDLIGNLAETGNWFHNLNTDHQIIEELIELKSDNIVFFGIDSTIYQNAGANMTQQIAYALAHANEYLNHFGDKAANSIQFKVAMGSNYFFEIAKIKALRSLFNLLVKEYTDKPTTVNILAFPSRRNKTLYDYNVNMLRSTSECMSAILGGANTISNLPYDAIYHHENEFGSRISRNQLQILKAESYFDKVLNPTEGAYYIEELTRQLAERALELFKQIEKSGGFLKQLKEGTIQRKIKESAAKEQEQFDNQEIILLGTNKHPNEKDMMKETIEKEAFLKIEKRKTLLEPIIQKRLAEELEQNRLKNE